MKLWAIGDLHLRSSQNRLQVEALRPRPEDWLILAGDIGETTDDLRWALEQFSRRFAQLFWVPGNHDLWKAAQEREPLLGVEKYLKLVEICREYGVATPEDPYLRWPGAGPPRRIVPLFLLYDYTFRPDHVPVEKAVEWAMAEEILCTDEMLLKPDPFPSREAWCHHQVEQTEQRLQEAIKNAEDDEKWILVNHFPLRQEHAVLPRIPRFSIWCGTRRTEDWHQRFRAETVIYGHLHIPRTLWRDGVRFEETSFGYPKNWQGRRTLETSLRQILPTPEDLSPGIVVNFVGPWPTTDEQMQ